MTRADRAACEGDLAELLGRAGGGDVAAFLAFYDRTSPLTFRYALAGSRGDRASAEELARDLYREAWRTAAQHPASGLSPVAWLIAGGRRTAQDRASTSATESPC
ncbi:MULTISPECIES: hypothetical protein [unclassified Nocardioides]|uniref:hypothetical protein n=1 Tax=unclassified Nocardioides TaxID=2615069 RepID=UPI0006F69016|nr:MULTISPECIES: hypothetical protein [unclassified Nocardioides]KRA38486.1 hypothetical protein ASD81_07635 [Nocardioides sp. Root614]